ncbi:glycine dehydrogenase [Shimwellia blattae]|uniref:glycine dehydrogenase n=1 Tax=Shimwellia blattae TaxID=563 RepID=UPI00157617A2|nr:glycine dehydrogenase [Shimwellia blattae]
MLKGQPVNNETAVVKNTAPEQSAAIEQLAEQALSWVFDLLKSHHIVPNAVQKQMLESHVRAMAHRSVTGEPLPEVDASLFDEISEDSLNMAKQIVAHFGNLPVEEAWLLSVHFEVAKDNL